MCISVGCNLLLAGARGTASELVALDSPAQINLSNSQKGFTNE